MGRPPSAGAGASTATGRLKHYAQMARAGGAAVVDYARREPRKAVVMVAALVGAILLIRDINIRIWMSNSRYAAFATGLGYLRPTNWGVQGDELEHYDDPMARVEIPAKPNGQPARVLVSYLYHEASSMQRINFLYFLAAAVQERSDVQYIITLIGQQAAVVPLPKYDNIQLVHASTVYNSNFVAMHDHALRSAPGAITDYDYVVLLNSTMRGPFTPTYLTLDSWLGILLRPLTVGNTALVTTTVGCLPVDKGPPFSSGPRGYYAHTGLMAFSAAGLAATRGFFNFPDAEQNHKNDPGNVMVTNALEVTQKLFSSGFGLRTLRIHDAGVDISKDAGPVVCGHRLPHDGNWYPRDYEFGAYLHPLEPVFVHHPAPNDQRDTAQLWQTYADMLQTKWRLTYVIKWTMAHPLRYAKRRVWMHEVEEAYGNLKKFKGKTKQDHMTYSLFNMSFWDPGFRRSAV